MTNSKAEEGGSSRFARGLARSQGPDWDYLATASFSDKWDSHWSNMLWRAFRRHIPDGASILEIGCGTGKISAKAVKHLGATAVGIDVNQRLLEYARGLARFVGVSATFLPGSGFEVPFADKSFDVVLSEGVIEHFPVAQTDRMVAEHARVCRPGGRVLMSVPNLLNLPLTYHKLRTGRKFHAYPERSYPVWRLSRMMRHHGLRAIGYGGFAPTIGLEWYIHRRLRFRWLDRWAPNWLLAVIGYEVLVAAEKEA